jgi:hypothetical protein
LVENQSTVTKSKKICKGSRSLRVYRGAGALKKAEGLSNDFHQKIMSNGDYVNAATGEVVGNLYDYVP